MSIWNNEFYWLNHPVNPPNPHINVWYRDLAGEGFAAALLRNYPVNHENGLQVTDLPFALGFDPTEDNRLITRAHSRSIYWSVFKQITANHEKKILVNGAPGIGKSRNLTYLLKLFLEANKIVLYHAGSSNHIYAFIPPPLEHNVDPAVLATQGVASDGVTRYRCYRAVASDFYMVPINNLALNGNVTLLYDPPKGPAEPPPLSCAVVIAASPNPRHFANFTSNKRHLTYYMNMYTLKEVQTFFDIIHGPTAPRSANAAPGVQVPTFETPCGPVPVAHRLMPLGDEHLIRGVVEVRISKLFH